jgi:hypothetical protein
MEASITKPDEQPNNQDDRQKRRVPSPWSREGRCPRLESPCQKSCCVIHVVFLHFESDHSRRCRRKASNQILRKDGSNLPVDVDDLTIDGLAQAFIMVEVLAPLNS